MSLGVGEKHCPELNCMTAVMDDARVLQGDLRLIEALPFLMSWFRVDWHPLL